MNEEVSLEELLAESAEELSRPIQEKHLTVSIGSMPGLKLTGSRVMHSRARSRAMGGSGLELPLVKDILEKHGGNITVKSTR